MSVIIYGVLITISIVLGILINAPFAKYALTIAGFIFEIAVMFFCIIALLQGHLHTPNLPVQNKLDTEHDTDV